MSHHPRSLNSLLADSRRESAGAPEEGELEGESKLIALGEDLAPLFEVPRTRSAAKAAGNPGNSSGELLTDLFPTGFTRSTLSSPLAAAAATVAVAAAGTAVGGELFGPTSSPRSLEEKEPRPSFTTAAVASSTETIRTFGIEGERELRVSAQAVSPLHLHPSVGSSQQLVGYYELQRHQQRSCGASVTDTREIGKRSAAAADGLATKTANANTTTWQEGAVGAAIDGATIRNATALSECDGQGMDATAAVSSRGREDDELKRTLHRLIPRLLQSEEKVKFLEGRLEQAKHAESGRNALVKQITRLEDEVKQSRQRLEMHHAEAIQWREQRQSLETDIERLSAELHRALGRNTRLETESRRKDVLLVEARKNADERAEHNSKFEAELRHKDQLLEEAERDKKRAWQTTNASAETAKAAVMRAEAAVKEATDLRNLRRDAGGHEVAKRSAQNVEFSTQERGLSDRTGREQSTSETQSLTEVVAAGATAATGGAAEPNVARRSWVPTEPRVESMPQRALGDGCHARSLSADRGGSLDQTEAQPAESDYCVRNKPGQRPAPCMNKDFGEEGPRVGSPQSTVMATDFGTPRAVSFDLRGGDSEPWRTDGGMLSPSTRESPKVMSNPILPTSGSRRPVAGTSPPADRATRREQCHDGDRQRHDSEGVRGALTGASPAWTDAPSKFGDGSSTAVASRRRSASSVRSVQRAGAAAVRQAGNMYGLSEEAFNGRGGCRDHTQVASQNVSNVTGEVTARVEGGVPFSADALSPVQRGWEQQGATPLSCPAAGHKKGRDLMSARRSSLSGAGVGVAGAVTGEAGEVVPTSPGSTGDARRPCSNAGNAMDAQHGDDAYNRRRINDNGVHDCVGAQSAPELAPAAANNRSPTDQSGRPASERRRASESGEGALASDGGQSSGRVPPTRTSPASAQLTGSLAILLEGHEPADASAKQEKAHPKRATSAPFATDAVEDELRPIREVERRLMLLQMETSQLEAEQSRLLPKASKTMQARVQLKKLESRLAMLANESSGLRKVLRQKPWRM